MEAESCREGEREGEEDDRKREGKRKREESWGEEEEGVLGRPCEHRSFQK